MPALWLDTKRSTAHCCCATLAFGFPGVEQYMQIVQHRQPTSTHKHQMNRCGHDKEQTRLGLNVGLALPQVLGSTGINGHLNNPFTAAHSTSLPNQQMNPQPCLAVQVYVRLYGATRTASHRSELAHSLHTVLRAASLITAACLYACSTTMPSFCHTGAL